MRYVACDRTRHCPLDEHADQPLRPCRFRVLSGNCSPSQHQPRRIGTRDQRLGLKPRIEGSRARLGIRLVNRTTRSVTLTAAGEQLYSALTEPMAAIGEAIDDLNRFREGPSG